MMILQDVLCDLKERLLESGFINEFYEYCELIKRDERTFPAYYIGGGEYKLVYDFDVNGAGYVRRTDDVRIETDFQRDAMLSCSDDNEFLNITYPLRAVLGVPKTLLGDDAYSDDRLFSEMVVIFGGSYEAANVQDVSTRILSYNTDSLDIWSREVQGVDHQMNFRLSYILINFNLTFSVNKSCLPEVCGYGY